MAFILLFARLVASPFRRFGRSAFNQRLEAIPWGIVIAGLAIIAGIVDLFNVVPPTDPLSILIGRWQILFGLVYFVAGMSMFLGIGLGIRWVHAMGVMLLGTSVFIRLVVAIGVLGLSRQTAIAVVFYLLILWAVSVNARALVRGDVMVQYRGVK